MRLAEKTNLPGHDDRRSMHMTHKHIKMTCGKDIVLKLSLGTTHMYRVRNDNGEQVGLGTKHARHEKRCTRIGHTKLERNCLFVSWLLNVPATCECISGTDLHRQFYVLPH